MTKEEAKKMGATHCNNTIGGIYVRIRGNIVSEYLNGNWCFICNKAQYWYEIKPL